MDNSASTPVHRNRHAHDAKAALVRTAAALALGPLLLLDLVLVVHSHHPAADCGRCTDHLTDASAASPVLWLVGVVGLLIAMVLPSERRLRAARAGVVLVSALGALAALLLVVTDPTG